MISEASHQKNLNGSRPGDSRAHITKGKGKFAFNRVDDIKEMMSDIDGVAGSNVGMADEAVKVS